MTTVGVLMPLPPSGPANDPAESALGRAAQKLAGEGIRIVFGSKLADGVLHGFTARTLSWTPVETRVRALFDNWPSYLQPDVWERLLKGAGDTPIANPIDFAQMCGDRLSLQRMLEMSGVRMTPTESKPERFGRALDDWGAGFMKPRRRGTGRRVTYVVKDGPIPDGIETMILQQSRGAPPGWDGMCVRSLAQRDTDGSWLFPQAVAFRSNGDMVAGSAPNAIVDPVERALPAAAVNKMRRVAEGAVEALCDDDMCVEVGVDFAIDRFYEPWLIDVESKPKWGLLSLARKQPGRWDAEIDETHCRPLRYLAMRGR